MFCKSRTFILKQKNLILVVCSFIVCSWMLAHAQEIHYDDNEYGIILDGGSTGTKLKVYKWKPVTTAFAGSILNVEQIESTKYKPGIRDYASRLDEVAVYLSDIIVRAKEVVPRKKHWRTPIFFMATAGLRILSEPTAIALLDKIEYVLKFTPFLTLEDNVKVLSGEEEAVFAWIATNYLNGFLWTNKPSTMSVGVLEMGGGSTQIAFMPEAPIYANMFPVRLGGQDYNLYAQSYLFYGQSYIISRTNDNLIKFNGNATQVGNPCMLINDTKTYTTREATYHLIGTGNYSYCQNILDMFLKTADDNWCYPKPCAIGRTYQPAVGTMLFYAISSFVYSPTYLKALDDEKRLNISLLRDNAKTYCGKTLDEAGALGIPATYESAYCTMALYIPSLLVDAYGFSLTSQDVIVTSEINDVDIDWSLGAMLLQLDNRLEEITRRTYTSGASQLRLQLASYMCSILTIMYLILTY